MTMTIPGIIILSMTLIQMMTSMITQHSILAFHDIKGIITSCTYKELDEEEVSNKSSKEKKEEFAFDISILLSNAFFQKEERNDEIIILSLLIFTNNKK